MPLLNSTFSLNFLRIQRSPTSTTLSPPSVTILTLLQWLALPAIRMLWKSTRRAFYLTPRSASPIVPGSHTGSLNCPNAPILLEKREAFVARCCQHQPASAQISAISNAPENPIPDTLTYHHPPTQDEGNSLTNSAPLDLSPLEGYNKQYEEYDESACATVAVPIATVHVHLDCSTKNRLLVPVSFCAPNGYMVPATILVDTGDMVNFINKGFVRKHELNLRQWKTPIRCDWSMPGLPWLDKQGWIASGGLNGGHQFTLGLTPLYVIKSTLGGGTPGGKLFTPSS
ncbi:hypothetical protein PCANC_26927 [Puccinia coronata f. sp. avenae]|uniref:Uncharacterized protein n=1 Tax=Puccinia coronata f. sp. avenae TaxID=200324 RepID=A0A2N5TQM1_9BASI|nr:hypothetical protein PCANC_26927 [Puccinia coronata f. sp. avenae]